MRGEGLRKGLGLFPPSSVPVIPLVSSPPPGTYSLPSWSYPPQQDLQI